MGEGILFAAQNQLSKLILIVDYNQMQALGQSEKILNLDSLRLKFLSFNWAVKEVDGHCEEEIETALQFMKNCSKK